MVKTDFNKIPDGNSTSLNKNESVIKSRWLHKLSGFFCFKRPFVSLICRITGSLFSLFINLLLPQKVGRHYLKGDRKLNLSSVEILYHHKFRNRKSLRLINRKSIHQVVPYGYSINEIFDTRYAIFFLSKICHW